MKSFTRTLFFLLALSSGHALCAQIWSDVGNQGFATNSAGIAGSHFPMIEIQSTTPYWAYVKISGEVTVMRNVVDNWQALPIVASFGDTPHLTFNNTGMPYIVYQTSGTSVVKKYDAGAWVSVGSGAVNTSLNIDGALVPKIAIDPSTYQPFIVFVDAGGGINVAKFNGTSWVLVGQTIRI